jgi:hypothetical protein
MENDVKQLIEEVLNKGYLIIVFKFKKILFLRGYRVQ